MLKLIRAARILHPSGTGHHGTERAGRPHHGRPGLEDVADADDLAVQDVGQAAAVELARAEVLTDGQRRARELTEKVVEYYRRRGLPGHARARWKRRRCSPGRG